MSAALRAGGPETIVEKAASAPEEAAEAVAAVYDRRENVAPTENGGHRPPLQQDDGAPNAWPDESAEAAMMSELKSRGEMATPAPTEAVEETTDTKNLPPLDDLVKRIPPEVREALDDLFRVKFVRVVRVPAKALKS